MQRSLSKLNYLSGGPWNGRRVQFYIHVIFCSILVCFIQTDIFCIQLYIVLPCVISQSVFSHYYCLLRTLTDLLQLMLEQLDFKKVSLRDLWSMFLQAPRCPFCCSYNSIKTHSQILFNWPSFWSYSQLVQSSK